MLGMVLAFPWMAGSWFLPATSPVVRDINGVSITVGATVKMVGTVQAVHPTDPDYGTITILPLHPDGSLAEAVTVEFKGLNLVVGS